jgi:hypothetical protein
MSAKERSNKISSFVSYLVELHDANFGKCNLCSDGATEKSSTGKFVDLLPEHMLWTNEPAAQAFGGSQRPDLSPWLG